MALPLLLRFFLESPLDAWADQEALKLAALTTFEKLCRDYPVFKEAADKNKFAPVEAVVASIENLDDQREMRKIVAEEFGSKRLIKAQERIARELTNLLEE